MKNQLISKIFCSISVFFGTVFFCVPVSLFGSTLYFNNAVDTSWNTLGNWWTNASYTNPSSVFPHDGDIVYIGKLVNTSASSTVTLGHIHVAHSSTGGGEDVGFLPGLVVGDVTFYSAGYQEGGQITGNAIFNDFSIEHNGTITGVATFNNGSHTYGTVTVGSAIFNNDSYQNFSSTLTGNTIFNDNSWDEGDIIGSVVFNDNSHNTGDAHITGDVVFNGATYNEAEITGNAVFNGTSVNFGTINGNACFGLGATNNGTVTGVIYDCNDVTAPTISSVTISNVSDTGATITWITNEVSLGQINYGTGTTYSSFVSDNLYATSHSLALTGLESCTRYGFNVQSADPALNIATSSDSYFLTTGCTGGSSISSSGLESIATSTGGTLSLGDVVLLVPVGFSESASSSVTFQVHSLDATVFSASAGSPAGSTMVGSTVINLQAFDGLSSINEFDEPLSVTFSYSLDDLHDVYEPGLKIYRYDYPLWTALSSCVVDTHTHTVTCLTNHFSDFALFGTSRSSSGGGGGSSGSVTLDTNKSIDTISSTNEKVDEIMKEKINILTRVNTRNLYFGLRGEDVKTLQEFLNLKGFTVSLTGFGSKGNESIYFGYKTRDALMKYQKSSGIKPALGYFGPITKMYILSH